jgi:hypothetical protein
MKAIEPEKVQAILDKFTGREMYLHLETTNGSYAALRGDSAMSVCAYIRNGKITYNRGKIIGSAPYRVGLKMEHGWIYATALTDYEITESGQLLLAGHNEDGRLAVALEISETPFQM